MIFRLSKNTAMLGLEAEVWGAFTRNQRQFLSAARLRDPWQERNGDGIICDSYRSSSHPSTRLQDRNDTT